MQTKQKINISEILFLCFWVIMLFIKGIGLYDGQTIYNVLFVVALMCLLFKFMYTEHTLQEWLFIILFNLLGLVAYMYSKEKGILICTMLITSMKNVSLERIAKSGLMVWGLSMGGRIGLSLIMLDSTKIAIQNKNIIGYVCRYYLGFPHPNTLHISYFFLVALCFLAIGKKINLKAVSILFGGNILLFLYSYSITGFLISTVLIVLGYYATKKENFNWVEKTFVKIWYPICLLISLGIPLVMQGKVEEILNKLLNNRFKFSKMYLALENLKLFGINVGELTTSKRAIDNSYVHGLLSYGIILFVILSVLYIFMVLDFVNKKKNVELMVFVVCLLGGLTEPYLFNTSFKNITLIFIGYSIYAANLTSKIDLLNRKWKLFNDKAIEVDVRAISRIENFFQISKQVNLGKKRTGIVVVSVLIAVICLHFYTFREEILKVYSSGIIRLESLRVFVTVVVFLNVISDSIYKIIYVKKHKKG